MIDNYCMNCRHYDGLFKCNKTCEERNPVCGKRIYAYREGDMARGLVPKDVEDVRAQCCKGNWFEPSRWARLKEGVRGLLWRNVTSKMCECDSSHQDGLDKMGNAEANATAKEILEVLNNGVEDDEKSGQITFCFRDGEWSAYVFSPYLAEMVKVEHADSIEEGGKELLELCRMLMEAKK